MMTLPELSRPGVHIKNAERVNAIIRNMINKGNQHLQVVSDFDMTLTKFKDDQGRPCDTCYRALEVSKLMPSSYTEQALAMKDHYYAIEVHPDMTTEEKIPYMVEWWTKAHDLLLQCDVKQSYIEQMVSASKIHFRDGHDWLFRELHKYGVPLLILSAGIGDIIIEAIKQRAVLYDNIQVVSNFMDFDEKGVLKGFKGDLVHVFNKNENAVHKSQYFEKLVHRDSILLLGDSLGDLHMADGADECANLLTVGYLNDKVEERLSKYIDAFDIVLVNDSTLEIPNAIVKHILEGRLHSQDQVECENS